MEWLTWGNGAYLIAIIIGGVATLVATKYRPALKECKRKTRTSKRMYGCRICSS